MDRLVIFTFAAAACAGRPPSTVAPPTASHAGLTPTAGSAPHVDVHPDSALTSVDALSPGEALRILNQLGAHVIASAPGQPADLPAVGACLRPSDAERRATETRIRAWVVRTTPGESDEPGAPSLLQLRFGCVEAGGLVVDAQIDRIAKSRTTPNVGHWWTLRVTPTSIKQLAGVQGIATLMFQEWANEHTLATVALVDLDRDGTLDALVAEQTHEGGAMTAEIALSIARSKSGYTSRIAEFGDSITLVGGVVAGPAIVRIDDRAGPRYRCIDTALVLADCPEAAVARARDAGIEIAAELTRSKALPDREQLAEWLEALAVPPASRPPLLAAAPATTPALHAVRAIHAFASPVDNRTTHERATADLTAGEAERAAARDQLRNVDENQLRDAQSRDAIVEALTLAGADPRLVAEVARVR